MKQIYFLPVVLALAWCAGCSKVINVDLNNASPQLVIQGNVYDTAGPYYVQLSQTVNFSADNTFPPVSNAQVTITDSTIGVTDHLTETVAGTYATSSINGVPGHTYLLSVNVNGKVYNASSTMPAPVAMDSLSFETDNIFGENTIYVKPNFQDVPGVNNYYIFSVYINNLQPDKQVFNYSDRLSDGKYLSLRLNLDSSYIKVGDTVAVKMGCVDKPVYDYYNSLETATGNSSSTPSNPTSNISNGALGYFSAQTTQTKKAVAY
jgi:hypothetical protein